MLLLKHFLQLLHLTNIYIIPIIPSLPNHLHLLTILFKLGLEQKKMEEKEKKKILG